MNADETRNPGPTGADDLLLEAATSAFREQAATGRIKDSPAWWDLSPAARRALFDRQLASRVVERTLDPAGLSGTARAVLGRLPGVGQLQGDSV